MLIAVRSGTTVTYRHTKRKARKRKGASTMGNALNPPDTKKRLKPIKCPRGEKAIGHRVEICYDKEDGTSSWERAWREGNYHYVQQDEGLSCTI